MPNTVLILSAEVIHTMKSHYEKELKRTPPPGAVFAAKSSSFSITAYRSGKVLFQGKDAEQEAAKWGSAAPSTKTPVKEKPKAHLPSSIASMSLIGTDEVGTGDYFGPITVVAAYVRKDQLALLQEYGVKDSKHLKDPAIIDIAKKLIHTIPYSLLTLRNEKYNERQAKGWTQGKIKAALHNQAIVHLQQKIEPEKPEGILIDQFAEKDIYYRHLKGQTSIVKENVWFSTKAESIHLSVAAASIIARYAFLRAMDSLSEEAGFPLPKGAGSKVDAAAAKLIKSKGMQELNHFTKLHFANTQKAQRLSR
ncbi:ribonuclease HIII [Jeotgalibacillus proteolyticus]|uniref:Ribonuclease HIII n=1 Tax=Jeotgalibacillus proteolyticus TaxID=2082395 RepID=A0A2S5GEY5_9BACL|nr:ribonuclease HIII [Jeotgalibacillus proteolyticus]PPA71590.1 ribonuclease HIII [Jeotgalibacillus proteolyticus]